MLSTARGSSEGFLHLSPSQLVIDSDLNVTTDPNQHLHPQIALVAEKRFEDRFVRIGLDDALAQPTVPLEMVRWDSNPHRDGDGLPHRTTFVARVTPAFTVTI